MLRLGGGSVPVACWFSRHDGQLYRDYDSYSITGLAPKWVTTLDANCERLIRNSLIAAASVNVRYTSSYSTYPFDQPDYVQGQLLAGGFRVAPRS